MIGKRFYVSKSGEIAYLNIAKSGCTSIKVALSRIRDSSPEVDGFNVHNPDDYDLLFLDVLSPESRLLRNTFKFTFVRNPVDRALSFYRNKILTFDENVTPYYQSRGIKYGCDIDSFIRALVCIDPLDLEEHLYPQAYTIFDKDQILVDWVGHLENISTHWLELMSFIGRDVEIQATNETEKDARSRPSDETMALLMSYYKMDGYCFGYYQKGEISTEMEKFRELFEQHRSGRVSMSGQSESPEWPLVHRIYLQNIHSQLAHLRRQIRGVNHRLEQIVQDKAQKIEKVEVGDRSATVPIWRKWIGGK